MGSKYGKLIITGNGFDRWQGLPTSYDHFKDFYRTHIREIVKALHIKTTRDERGAFITPVEMIFGDISRPSELPDEFFRNFEAAMALPDDQSIIHHFGKTNKGLYNLRKTVREAQAILQQAFCDWILSIEINPEDSGFSFDDGCYLINFNYTDTLEKRFCVNKANVYHIHGDAADPESIIFGHAAHPETAFSELMEQRFVRLAGGGKSKRLAGLYLIEDALYETDKHVQDNIDDLCEFMMLDGVHFEDFTDIYVLGHSFAETDYEYFEFLIKATQAGCDFNELSALWKVRNIGVEKLTEENNLLDFIHYNIIYAASRRKRVFEKENISFPMAEMVEKAIFGRNNVYTDGDGNVHDMDEASEKSKEAVHKRFLIEQAARTKDVMEEFCLLKGINEIPPNCYSVLSVADQINGGHERRSKDAVWHISCHSDQDRQRINNVMQSCGCTAYELYPSIEECIAGFWK